MQVERKGKGKVISVLN